MGTVQKDRSVGIRMLVMLSVMGAAGTALLLLPVPAILAHAAPAIAHVLGLRPITH